MAIRDFWCQGTNLPHRLTRMQKKQRELGAEPKECVAASQFISKVQSTAPFPARIHKIQKWLVAIRIKAICIWLCRYVYYIWVRYHQGMAQKMLHCEFQRFPPLVRGAVSNRATNLSLWVPLGEFLRGHQLQWASGERMKWPNDHMIWWNGWHGMTTLKRMTSLNDRMIWNPSKKFHEFVVWLLSWPLFPVSCTGYGTSIPTQLQKCSRCISLRQFSSRATPRPGGALLTFGSEQLREVLKMYSNIA